MVDPNETPELRAKAEQFQSFRRGWQHGAGARARDPRFEEHSRDDISGEYERGYVAGYEAMCLAGMKAAERLHYDPRMSILRTAAPVEPPVDPAVPELVRCDESMPGERKVRCSLITDGHGPEHKRFTPTGRVTHKWPAVPSSVSPTKKDE